MAVTLRLYRVGKKGYATYKIVAVNKRYKSNGKYIEAVGIYNPHKASAKVDIKKERLEYWLTRGAVVSEGLRKLIKKG